MNNDLKQDIYQEPEMEIVTFGTTDIIKASNEGDSDGENRLPIA